MTTKRAPGSKNSRKPERAVQTPPPSRPETNANFTPKALDSAVLCCAVLCCAVLSGRRLCDLPNIVAYEGSDQESHQTVSPYNQPVVRGCSSLHLGDPGMGCVEMFNIRELLHLG